jgi:KDO2-lipid IV(A) lauroyltransferase
MKMNFAIDYLSCIAFRILGPIVRILPLNFSLFLGRRLGDLLYYFDVKHKCLAYSNIKIAFGDKFSPSELSKITRDFYQAFGQNLIEIFLIPLVNREYINKYINIEGVDNVARGFKQGRGVIFLSVHAGSWELSNIICACLGIPFNLFVRDQRYPRLNNLLNRYRTQKGCRLIQRKNQIRQLIEILKKNEAVGMTADQGGKTGIQVKFFSKIASMPTGAMNLALKYGAAIIPVFFTRLHGPYSKVIVAQPVEIKKSNNYKKDLYDNLQTIVSLFEKYITIYPKEYLWSYKIYKYGNEKKILILSDGKTGHLRQSEAVVKIIEVYLAGKGIGTEVYTQEIRFKSELSRNALALGSSLAGKYNCQGCLWCLRRFLKKDSYESVISLNPDIIISCGSSVACVNYVLSRENLAKSIVVTRPSILSTKRFDLVVMPRHDQPAKGKNIVVTEGALNLIDEQYLDNCISHIAYRISKENDKRLAISDKRLYIGLLMGGDTKNFCLTKEKIFEVISQIKSVSEKLNADILVTTSRRTSKEVEGLLKKELQDYPRCKLLIIANEKNIPQAVGGILGLSAIVITSPESISMISEAVSSKKYVLVFQASGLSRKHKIFIDYFARNQYIYKSCGPDLSERIQDILSRKPQIRILQDNRLVEQAINRIL